MVKIFDLISAPEDTKDLPDESFPYYIAAKQGLYIRKKGPLGTALVPTSEMPPTLKAISKDAEKGLFTYTAERLPAALLASAVDFFHAIYKKHKAEAEVLILLASASNTYSLFCPYQRVSGTGVRSIYDPTTLPAGTQAIGSIHSHCNMAAFHSGTDTADASSFPGLHITVGTLTAQGGPTYAAMVMFNGIQFDYDIAKVALTDKVENPIYPSHWLERVITYSENERAKIIADTILNVSEEDKRRFLGTEQPKWQGKQQHMGWHNGTYGMYEAFEHWTGYRSPETAKQIHSGPTKKPRHQMRWSTELHVNVNAELLDKNGEFLGPDEAIEAITEQMERVKGAAANYDLGFGWEITDVFTGQTIAWSLPEEEEDEDPGPPPATLE